MTFRDVISAVDFIASGDVKFVFEDARLGGGDHRAKRADSAQIVLGQQSTLLGGQVVKVRRAFDQRLNGRVERTDDFQRVTSFRSDFRWKRRLLLEQMLRADAQILFVVGVNGVREEIPFVERQGRTIVVQQTERLGLNGRTSFPRPTDHWRVVTRVNDRFLLFCRLLLLW